MKGTCNLISAGPSCLSVQQHHLGQTLTDKGPFTVALNRAIQVVANEVYVDAWAVFDPPAAYTSPKTGITTDTRILEEYGQYFNQDHMELWAKLHHLPQWRDAFPRVFTFGPIRYRRLFEHWYGVDAEGMGDEKEIYPLRVFKQKTEAELEAMVAPCAPTWLACIERLVQYVQPHVICPKCLETYGYGVDLEALSEQLFVAICPKCSFETQLSLPKGGYVPGKVHGYTHIRCFGMDMRGSASGDHYSPCKHREEETEAEAARWRFERKLWESVSQEAARVGVRLERVEL